MDSMRTDEMCVRGESSIHEAMITKFGPVRLSHVCRRAPLLQLRLVSPTPLAECTVSELKRTRETKTRVTIRTYRTKFEARTENGQKTHFFVVSLEIIKSLRQGENKTQPNSVNDSIVHNEVSAFVRRCL